MFFEGQVVLLEGFVIVVVCMLSKFASYGYIDFVIILMICKIMRKITD
jgi:hypothetical protein